MSEPKRKPHTDATLTVTVRRSARRARDGWLEVERRNPETGETWWERLRPLYPGETAEGMTIVPDPSAP